MTAIPLALWATGRPLVRTVALGTLVVLAVGTRRAYHLLRCFRECQGLAFDLGKTVRITLTQPPTDDSA